MRNEKADDFLALLKEWSVLCDKYVHQDMSSDLAGLENEEDGTSPLDKDEFVVEKLIGICYGGGGRDNGLYFKVFKSYLFICTLMHSILILRISEKVSSITIRIWKKMKPFKQWIFL